MNRAGLLLLAVLSAGPAVRAQEVRERAPPAAPSLTVRLSPVPETALDTPVVRERMAKLGLEAPKPERRTPEYLGRFVADEMTKWAPVLKASGAGAE